MAFIAPLSLIRSSVSSSAVAVVTRSSTFTTARRSIQPNRRPRQFTSQPSRNMTRASLEGDVRKALVDLYEQTPCMPIMVRLGWHDAGTFNVNDGTGGANASIRFEPEKGHGANNGLNIAMDFLEPIKKQYPEIGYADLYQLASIVAIEYSGGPIIPFRMGRIDVTPEQCTDDGRLPDANKRMDHLRDVFYRMGLNDKDITVLSGAHTLGRAHSERSGFDGPWTHQYLKFDNTYFIEILKADPDPKLLRLASDLALLDIPETKALCEKYAVDQDAFFVDYIESHKKLSELGCFTGATV